MIRETNNGSSCLKRKGTLVGTMENGRRGGFQEMLVRIHLISINPNISIKFSNRHWQYLYRSSKIVSMKISVANILTSFCQGLVMKKGGKEEKKENKPLVTLHEEGSEERIKVWE